MKDHRTGAVTGQAVVADTVDFHIKNSPLGVVEWDSEFRVSFWSGRAEDFFGWTQNEVLGKHPDEWKFVHEDDVDSVAAIMDELLSGKAPRNISINRNYTRDGHVLHCEWYNSILTDEAGNLLSVFSLIHDVTERIEAEDQLRQLHKLESIGQLTGGVAHDFNNLLTVIIGNAGLLSEALGDRADLKALADVIVMASDKGAQLTSQLLSFARRQPLQPQAVNTGELLKELAPLLKRTLEAGISIEVHSHSDWHALADRNQLETSLLNLCINARDAMGGSGTLVLETQDVVLNEEYALAIGDIEPGNYVLIAVSDTGQGIDPHHLNKIFEPFFTTKKTGSGTGLGLSMVYGFVKQSKGHIKVYSELGTGTTVRIYLPRFSGSPKEPEVEPEIGSLEGNGEHVLVVEDDELVGQYVVGQLTYLGYQVSYANAGAQALELLENDASIELLLTDVVMPGNLSGPQVAARAKRNRPDLKVLYTSGYTENAIVHHGRLDPDVLLLSKPYKREMLARKVLQALHSK